MPAFAGMTNFDFTSHPAAPHRTPLTDQADPI